MTTTPIAIYRFVALAFALGTRTRNEGETIRKGRPSGARMYLFGFVTLIRILGIGYPLNSQL